MANLNITEKFSENPFIDTLDYSQKRKVTEKLANTDLKVYNGKKIVDDFKIVYAKEVAYDKAPFAKIFLEGLKILPKLSKSATKILFYILLKLEYNVGTIHISTVDVCREFGLKENYRSNITRGIKELLDNKIIARHTDWNRYWVNPNIIFKGDRKYLFYNNF